MKKFLLSMLALVAMSVSTSAQEITVPAELNGWYAGYYVATNIDIPTLKKGIDQFIAFDGLAGDTWTEDQQYSLESTCHWGDDEDPYSYFGQIKNNKFFVGGDLASKNYYAFFFINGPRMSAGTPWRMYIPPKRGACTLTNDDLYLQGAFGQGIFEPTGVKIVVADPTTSAKAIKKIVNGQLVIERNGEKYNLQGQVVK